MLPKQIHGRLLLVLLTTLYLGACSSSGGDSKPIAPVTHSISGTLTSLTGGSVVLQQSSSDDLTLSTNGSFRFVTPINDGAAYSVTVLTQPNGQSCTVSSGNGTVTGNDVTNVSVNCNPTVITSFELFDPTPGAGNLFGETVVLLANGNIMVSDPYDAYDSSVIVNNGAVHLYNPITQTRIASIYGDGINDLLGSSGIVALANSNFVIASWLDDENGLADTGSVRLVDGDTGVQIGAAIAGVIMGDRLGSAGITALANNNFVIASPFDYVNNISYSGSVRLVNGETGAQIGTPIVGDVAFDSFGAGSITALANNNYVITSPFDDENGIVNASSVRLVNGTTGAQIGLPIVGDGINDRLGSTGITALANNNFVIASEQDDEGGIVDAGSVRLVDGATGAQIGTPFVGNIANDRLGSAGITALANNNFVIASPFDDEGGIVDAGSVRLIDGATGTQIGPTIVGDVAFDSFGSGNITALANNNFVIASPFDDENGIVDAGSVRLIDGVTGAQIGTPIVGDIAFDSFGSGSITALANNNFVIASPFDDENGIVDAGSVRLIDGVTGAQIGTPIVGDIAFDSFGSGSITALANNNFVIASPFDDENGIVDAGSVRLVDGATGVQIGTAIVGDVAGDRLGSAGITALANNKFVIASQFDDEGGIVNAGSVQLVDGATGAHIGGIVSGSAAADMNGVTITGSVTGSFYVLGLPNADNNTMVDSGRVRLIAQ